MPPNKIRERNRRGGFARIRIHGNPGTFEGRRLGGLRSLLTHRKKQTGFQTLKKITVPKQSAKLAELCGILSGDGHISEYQVSVTTNALTDAPHALFVKKLCEELFRVKVSIKRRKLKNACTVLISSKAAVLFLVRKGMVRGNKITKGLKMPLWIQESKMYRLAFIRGLFDTDGCIFVDVHKTTTKQYRNLGMAFTNRSLPLLVAFKHCLEDMGLHPTQKTKYTVFLRRKSEILEYFRVVGSSNPKHLEKVMNFVFETEECPELVTDRFRKPAPARA